MPTLRPSTAHVPDEDDLEELPPLDGDTDDPDDGSGAELDQPAAPMVGDDGGLDDATGEDNPPDVDDLEVNEGDAAWVGEPQDAGELDVGRDDGLEIRDEKVSFVEVETPGDPAGDYGLEDIPEVAGLDSGEEGPLDPDEELDDRDLPALDADDGGEEGDSGLIDAHFGADQPAGLPWAQQPLERVGAPVALLSATAVACVPRGAVVAGRTESGSVGLLRVDLEGEAQSLLGLGLEGSEVFALTAEEGVLAVVLRDGRLLVSRDAGERFEPAGEGLVATDAALVRGALWVRTSSRGIAVSVGGGPMQRRSVVGAVAALCADGESGMTALAVDHAGVPTMLLHGSPDGSIETSRVSATEPCGPELVAARGPFVAYPGRRGVLRRGADGIWHAYSWQGTVTALAFADASGGLIAATYSDSDDTTALVLLDASGKASVVARLGPARTEGDLDGRAHSLVCDDARGVIWVAGGFGVAAFAIR